METPLGPFFPSSLNGRNMGRATSYPQNAFSTSHRQWLLIRDSMERLQPKGALPVNECNRSIELIVE